MPLVNKLTPEQEEIIKKSKATLRIEPIPDETVKMAQEEFDRPKGLSVGKQVSIDFNFFLKSYQRNSGKLDRETRRRMYAAWRVAAKLYGGLDV